jgi:xanthine dehydrogenase accessory factor
MGGMETSFWRRVAALEEERVGHVVVVLTGVDGSAPQEPGALMLATRGGLDCGTVGGGKVEAAALRLAAEMLDGSSAGGTSVREVEWNLQRDIGMTCGGVVRLVFRARNVEGGWTVGIFGAGHVAREVVRLLARLDATVRCADTRREWIERLPTSRHVTATLVDDLPAAVDALPPGAFLVSITQGHATDVPVLERAFRRGDLPFIGCIGSGVKAAKIRAELVRAGIAEHVAATLRCPVGLPLGSNVPEEIAISIVAQLLQERDAARVGGGQGVAGSR